MIDEIVKRVVDKTGMSPEHAQMAVTTVLGFLKERLPAPLASSLDSYLGGGESSGGGDMASTATEALGGLFGQK